MTRKYTEREVAAARADNRRIEAIWRREQEDGSKPQSQAEANWRREQREKQ